MSSRSSFDSNGFLVAIEKMANERSDESSGLIVLATLQLMLREFRKFTTSANEKAVDETRHRLSAFIDAWPSRPVSLAKGGH